MFIFVLDILCLSHLPVMHEFLKKQEDKLTENYKVKDLDGVKKRHREPKKKRKKRKEGGNRKITSMYYIFNITV